MAFSKLNNECCLKGHKLELKTTNDNKNNSFFKCDGCKERGFGVRYHCDRCDYDIHKECHCPLLTIQNPHFLGGHDFHFLRNLPSKSKPRFCDACGKQILGYLYHCEDRGWDLHPCCNNLYHNICFKDTELILHEILVDELMHDGKSKTKACFRCKKTTLSGRTDKGVPGWSYVSTCGNYWCHVYCLTEVRRSLHTARLAAAAAVCRRGPISINTSSSGEESLWGALSVVNNVTGLILGDPTAMLTAAFIEMFTG